MRTPDKEISIHVLREEDDAKHYAKLALQYISIHVLREEDDRPSISHMGQDQHFYPRPPR